MWSVLCFCALDFCYDACTRAACIVALKLYLIQYLETVRLVYGDGGHGTGSYLELSLTGSGAETSVECTPMDTMEFGHVIENEMTVRPLKVNIIEILSGSLARSIPYMGIFLSGKNFASCFGTWQQVNRRKCFSGEQFVYACTCMHVPVRTCVPVCTYTYTYGSILQTPLQGFQYWTCLETSRA